MHRIHQARGEVLAVLTPRQLEAALLVAEGCCNTEIGRRMGTSESTARNVITSVYRRLEIDSTAYAPRVRLARIVWEAQVQQLVETMLAEGRAA